MRFILVVERKHLFPGLSPQGFLPPGAVDLNRLENHLFYAEREFMESNSHFKQVIPYLVLQRGSGPGARVLVYQRQAQHSERRLGGLWSVGFGGHIEPLDRSDSRVRASGLVEGAALRELAEETGLVRGTDQIETIGYINSDREDVSSVHFGVVYRVGLDDIDDDDETLRERVGAQVEPHRSLWIRWAELARQVEAGIGPDGGVFEDWSRIVVNGLARMAHGSA